MAPLALARHDVRVSTIDPRTPVLVGTGQVSDRPAKGERTTRTPLDLMVEAS